ncbi:MAG: polyhydroxyalkanoate depolymerase [bacterium]|nr:polyhydroxyalkanoate depolymerase [bacterium]
MAYDFLESLRQGNQWMGASAKAFWGNPAFGLSNSPLPAAFAAWGEVTERSFSRIAAKPDWDIDSVVSKGREYVVNVTTVVDKPFGRLIQFKTSRKEAMQRKVLLIAPMSGHYATLLRKTVISLLPNCEVFVTEWQNARDIPVSKGSFDIEDFAKYLIEFFAILGPDLHVISVCQPVPMTLAAAAWIAEHQPKDNPSTLTLIGGPVDPQVNATPVTEFSDRVSIQQLEHNVIQSVGASYPGIGRRVYPGLTQLMSFMSMNLKMHSEAFSNQLFAVAGGNASDHDRHNNFYDEYLAVMDMPAEFYLSTVKRIFQDRELARNEFTIDGKHVDLGKITKTAVKVVEGGLDDISAPGQCAAALDLLTGLPDKRKAQHLEPGVGHYGIFSGKAWTEDIRPLVIDFIDSNS